ncbi:MAG: hypothetical protein KDH15_14105 [Rhodocyclaceae bacterium]|nr:hypothetical protein [Rhodocyclaceae bacterium]
MLSITDLLDFVELDLETVTIVAGATGLGDAESTAPARQLLSGEDGITLIHPKYRGQIDARSAARRDRNEPAQCYRRFSRKYPVPGAFSDA